MKKTNDFMKSLVADFEIALTSGYAGYLASDLLYASPNYISAINETVAVDFSHIYSYLGKRTLLIMKNAGLNEALLPIVNSHLLGTNAGMVLWIVDDLDVEASESCQDSRELIRLLGTTPKKPNTWAELYSMTREAYLNGEKVGLPQSLIISNALFESEITFRQDTLKNKSLASKEICILHPKTAEKFMNKFNQKTTSALFPALTQKGPTIAKLEPSTYVELFTILKKQKFDLFIGDFGTYTLAKGSPIKYGLHYGGAIASGVGASLAGIKPLVVVGEGGFTSGFEASLELIRKKPEIKIILIENNGISGQEDVGIDLTKICESLNISSKRITSTELDLLPKLLGAKGPCLIAVNYEH